LVKLPFIIDAGVSFVLGRLMVFAMGESGENYSDNARRKLKPPVSGTSVEQREKEDKS
jgi:hypothetical protein